MCMPNIQILNLVRLHFLKQLCFAIKLSDELLAAMLQALQSINGRLWGRCYA